MKKNIMLIACILVLLVVLARIGLWSWQIKNRCQLPLLPNAPSQMPNNISGLLGRMILARQRIRNMPSWWEYQADIPHPEDDLTGVVWEIAAQDYNIWLMHSSVIQRYDVNSGKRYDYRATESGQTIKKAKHILVSQTGILWAVVRLDDSFALTYFDADKDSFRIVHDHNNLFSKWENVISISVGSNIEETPEGRILIPFQKNILQYSPHTNVAQLLLPATFDLTINSIAVSGNNLWFTVNETTDLWNLDLSTKTTTNYGHVLQEYHGPIAIDHLGRVWMGYFARLEPDENGHYQWWCPESYPPEFVYIDSRYLDSLSGTDEYQYYWASVAAVDITSDESIWFSTSAGIVKYDIKQDDWCLSAPNKSYSVTEDKYGNLWIAPATPYYQGLYKYKLKQ